MNKRIFSFLLAILMVLSISSCEKNSKKRGDDFDYDEYYEDEDYEDDIENQTVYVSKSGKIIHRISYCSGMKKYDSMKYSRAVSKGYAFCKNCW